MIRLSRLPLLVVCILILISSGRINAFIGSSRSLVGLQSLKYESIHELFGPKIGHKKVSSLLTAQLDGDDEDLAEVEEEARLKVLSARRKNIRGMLKSAESLRNYRLENGFVPELDENGEPIQSDSKFAVTITAFVVAAGAVTLRLGGRAALVSAVGLDFANENPQLKDGLESFLSYAQSLDPLTEGGIFILAWTAVKVFCFDFGGIILALSSGILFGGVLQGAAFSALAATIGSSVAFGLAKLDTPVRKKALEIVDDYPSLRGIERVVAEDGLKAILTLRLAPVLPIPLGLYNYVYGVTNVPFLDFAGGIFLGSLKPYLLDSYLGYFGKQVIDGSIGQDGGIQDVILLVALGVSVLIGVFASQLAGETWESVKKEIEEEEKAKKKGTMEEEEEEDGITRTFLGIDLPQWFIGFQLSLKASDKRMNEYIDIEYKAAVWNYTESIPAELDPAKYPDSPEIVYAGTGFDVAASICDGLVLSPCLFAAYLKYADPLFNVEKELKEITERLENNTNEDEEDESTTLTSQYTSETTADTAIETTAEDTILSQINPKMSKPLPKKYDEQELLEILSKLKEITKNKISYLEQQINK